MKIRVEFEPGEDAIFSLVEFEDCGEGAKGWAFSIMELMRASTIDRSEIVSHILEICCSYSDRWTQHSVDRVRVAADSIKAES